MSNPTADFMLTLRIARIIYPEMVAEREAEVQYHSENGHRPSHCIHGTYQWTDYDNICGGCEEGVSLRRMAVERAAGCVKRWHERITVVCEAERLHRASDGLVSFDRLALVDWMGAPIARFLKEGS